MPRRMKTFTCSDANCNNTFQGQKRKGLCEKCYNLQYRKVCTICSDSYYLDQYKRSIRSELRIHGKSVITQQVKTQTTSFRKKGRFS